MAVGSAASTALCGGSVLHPGSAGTLSALTHPSPEEPAKGISAFKNKNKRNFRIQLLLRKFSKAAYMEMLFLENPMPEDLSAVGEGRCWQTRGAQCLVVAVQLKKY